MPFAALLVAAALGGGLSLDAPEAFVPFGTSAQFNLAGAPGAAWFVSGSLKPAEIPVPGIGTLLIAPPLIPLGQGTFAGGGTAQLLFPVPASPGLVGTVLYAQARQVQGSLLELSNSVAIRVESAPLAGSREPGALAAAADGSKLYVAFEEEGALAVVSAASGATLREIPLGPAPEGIPFGALHLELDPDGTRLYAVDAADDAVTVIDTASDSVVALVPVPRSSRGAVVTGSGAAKRLWVTNDAFEQVREYAPAPPAGWTLVAAHQLAGRGAGPIAALPDGRLLVGHRVSRAVERLDASGASQGLIGIGGVPRDILVDGGRALVPAFAPAFPPGAGAKFHSVLELDLASFTVLASRFQNIGTDYVDVALRDPWLVVVAHGSGTLLVADRTTLQLAAVLDLNPPVGFGFAPSANPVQADFTGAGAELRAWTADYFRDALRPIALGGGAPFALEPEVPVSHSGAVLSPLVDLSEEMDGDWWFRSVQFFNGSPLTPNPVTCYTCHPSGAADGLEVTNQRPPLWEADLTGPWSSKGTSSSLLGVIQGAFNAHSIFGGTFPPGSDLEILAFLSNDLGFPPSPFLAPSGVLNPAQAAGKVVFDGQAKCATCHAAPLFLPPSPNPVTIAAGVGTGLVPANVPTLRGIWSTAPYFKNGSAATLQAVLLFDSGNKHGETSGLTAEQRSNLVEYLKTL